MSEDKLTVEERRLIESTRLNWMGADDRRVIAIIDRIAPKPEPKTPGHLMAEAIYSAGCHQQILNSVERSKLEVIAQYFLDCARREGLL